MNSTESMNKELEEWLEETKQTLQIHKDDSPHSHKTPQGPCSICGDHQSKFVCLKCGRFVCPSCYFKLIGICKKCVPKETTERWEGKHPDWEKELGVEWVI
jgi:late competence protein required for DNA uptake (superfamily II DNA/RNA helicase)